MAEHGGTYQEDQHRAECEARHWLKVTRGDPVAVDSAMAAVAKRRGQPAADRLRELMRVEWRKGR